MIIYINYKNNVYSAWVYKIKKDNDDFLLYYYCNVLNKAFCDSFNKCYGKILFLNSDLVADIDDKNCFLKKIKELYSFLLNEYKFKKKLDGYFFEGFMHETTIENCINIFNDGFLICRNNLQNKSFNDNANKHVLLNTDNDVLNYVRLYWRKKTPTNYNFDSNKKYLNQVYLVFKWDIINLFGTRIYGGNAASDKTKHYLVDTLFIKDDLKISKNIDWDTVFSFGPYFSNKEEITRKRNAELQVYNKLSICFIKKIVFPTELLKDKFLNSLNEEMKRKYINKVFVDKDYFFIK